MTTTAQLLLALQDDDRPGFLHEEGTWTFRQVVEEGRRRAGLFESLRDPERPPHIGVLLDNAPDYLFWLVAAALSRSVIVGINSTYRGAQLGQLVEHSDCQVLVTSSGFSGLLEGAGTSLAGDRILEVDSPAHAAAKPFAIFDAAELDAFLATQPDLGPKWVPAFVRVDDDLPKLASMKIDKSRLRQETWTVPGVVWRPGRAEALRALTDDDRARLEHLLPGPSPTAS